MADFDNENKPRPKREVIIEDMRHRRDVDDTEGQEEKSPEDSGADIAVGQDETPAEIAAAASVPPSSAAETNAPAEEASIATDGGIDAVATDVQSADPEGEPREAGEYSDDEIRAIEREQLRQIISLGLVNYLKYQLTMVLNFALLNLGSAPDPVSGLVTKDLPQAKLAIDVLEFFVARLQGEMSASERAQMTQLVSDLKYSFMQAAAGGDIPPPPGETTGEA